MRANDIYVNNNPFFKELFKTMVISIYIDTHTPLFVRVCEHLDITSYADNYDVIISLVQEIVSGVPHIHAQTFWNSPSILWNLGIANAYTNSIE